MPVPSRPLVTRHDLHLLRRSDRPCPAVVMTGAAVGHLPVETGSEGRACSPDDRIIAQKAV